MDEKQKLIKSFLLTEELDEYVINLLYEEFLKPGLILLPSGNTFEKNIYPKLDSLFSAQEFETFNSQEHNTKKHELQRTIHPGLKLSHLDELILDKDLQENSFANTIKKSLPSISEQIKDGFYSIDVEDLTSFERYIKANNLRVIFAGLGADELNAHFAFIGEEFINSQISKITLSESMQEAHHCKEAVTIGTDLLNIISLEKIYVVVKGTAKAKSLKAAFEDDTTGLGYVIANHSDKLCIIADQEALSLI